MLVIAGPSGVGKSTIARALAARHERDAFLSVSATTRAPRTGESDGKEYRFMTAADFASARSRGEFLESAEYAGNWYGTPRAPVEHALAEGKHVILEIDVQGARQIKKELPDAVAVFIEPPSWDALRSRIGGRGTEDPLVIERRMKEAMREVAAAEDFDHRVVNDDLQKAVEAVDRLLLHLDETHQETNPT